MEGEGERRTSGLIQALFDRLELCFELLILHGQTTICVLQQRFQVLDAFVACKQFAFGNARLLLQSRILVNELTLGHVSFSTWNGQRKWS